MLDKEPNPFTLDRLTQNLTQLYKGRSLVETSLMPLAVASHRLLIKIRLGARRFPQSTPFHRKLPKFVSCRARDEPKQLIRSEILRFE